jgi:hypothetical protein
MWETQAQELKGTQEHNARSWMQEDYQQNKSRKQEHKITKQNHEIATQCKITRVQSKSTRVQTMQEHKDTTYDNTYNFHALQEGGGNAKLGSW